MKKLNAYSKPRIALFIFALLMVLSSYYFEYLQGLAPCLLCYLQRWTLLAILFVCFLSLIFRHQLIAIVTTVILVILSFGGLYFAIRQVWLQTQPHPEAYSCLPSIDVLYKTLPFTQFLKLAYQGTQDCGIVHFHLLGLSLAQWSLVGFIVLCIIVQSLIWPFFSTAPNEKRSD